MLHGGVHMWMNDLKLGALLPWTLRHGEADHESLRPAAQMPRIEYAKYDGTGNMKDAANWKCVAP